MIDDVGKFITRQQTRNPSGHPGQSALTTTQGPFPPPVRSWGSSAPAMTKAGGKKADMAATSVKEMPNATFTEANRTHKIN